MGRRALLACPSGYLAQNIPAGTSVGIESSDMDAPTAERQTISMAELAEMLGVSYRLIADAVARGEIDGIRVGRRVVIPKAVVDRMLNGGKPSNVSEIAR